jgi:eukaryotic-like serine/threonine-protein kinase
VETHPITQNLEPNSGSDRSQQLQAGTTLASRYLIQNVIGVGGMGAVYRARDLHFPNVVKLVAVKEMVNQTPDPLVRKTIVRNFEREANLLATLEHRAIPRIYDYFSINERSYLVLEYINGRDLEALLNDSDTFLAEDRILGWAIELCEVLEYLHNHRPEAIIFRDMKPSNIMINNQDHVVLVDFGIAKQFQSGQRGTMIGTEGYSPPEQYRGEATPLVDIYALGATLHHVFTRRDPRLEPPFSFGERIIHQINPNVSPEMELVIKQALEYIPNDRYPNAKAMKEALLALAERKGTVSRVASSAARSSQAKEGLKPVWTFKCEDDVRGTPLVQEGVVYAGSYDNNLYALSAGKGEFLWKYPADGGIVSRPAVYENNIFFGSEDKCLYVVQTRSGRINWTYYTEGPIRSSPRIAEGHVFVGSDDGRMHAINTQSGRRAWFFEAEAPIRSTPLVEHDFVYFGSENGDFYCLDFSGGVKWRFKAKRAITSSPIISKGIVYFGAVDSTLYALDAKSGWVIWRFRLGKASISSPAVADNFLFTGAVDGAIYCIDATTAKEVWRYNTEHQVTGSPVVFKDSIYCGSVDGYLYCLEYRTGRLRWKFKTEGSITGTPATSDEMVYVGSTDHRIYALMA